MNDKELDSYMKTVNPNFDSHIEKGTIEMSNEYYNLLEEKMARLINQNQELKKQLENNSKINVSDHKYASECEDKVIVLKNQQKEFIKYLEDEFTKIQNDIEKEIDNNVKYFKVERRQIITEILQKYKEIIGVSDESR